MNEKMLDKVQNSRERFDFEVKSCKFCRKPTEIEKEFVNIALLNTDQSPKWVC